MAEEITSAAAVAANNFLSIQKDVSQTTQELVANLDTSHFEIPFAASSTLGQSEYDIGENLQFLRSSAPEAEKCSEESYQYKRHEVQL